MSLRQRIALPFFPDQKKRFGELESRLSLHILHIEEFTMAHLMIWLVVLTLLGIWTLGAWLTHSLLGWSGWEAAAGQDVNAVWTTLFTRQQSIDQAAYLTLGSPKYERTRSGLFCSMFMWAVVTCLSLSLVRTCTREPSACLRSEFSRSSGLSSGL